MLISNPAANESASLSVNRLVDFQPNAVNKRIRVGVELVFCLFLFCDVTIKSIHEVRGKTLSLT